jgi:threonine/homoserine/homoserine lactone efflux protein
MLVTARGRANGLAFVAGWCVGVAAVGTILLLLAGGADASEEGEPATWVGVLELVLGALLLLVALREWRGRPHEGEEVATPKWMGALDRFTPVKAAGAAVVLSAANPKNLLLIVAGAAAIAQAGVSAGEQAIALLVFVVIASVGVATPVVIAVAMGDRSAELLGRLKDWLAHNNAVIMAVLLLVIGVKLIGDGIAAL